MINPLFRKCRLQFTLKSGRMALFREASKSSNSKCYFKPIPMKNIKMIAEEKKLHPKTAVRRPFSLVLAEIYQDFFLPFFSDFTSYTQSNSSEVHTAVLVFIPLIPCGCTVLHLALRSAKNALLADFLHCLYIIGKRIQFA